MPEYRYLEKDEIIQAGDEVDCCRDPWRDPPMWMLTQNIGEKAPDPRFPAHRIYRRRVTELISVDTNKKEG